MGTPSSWPAPYKRALLVTATTLVILSYLFMCFALARLSVLLVH